MGWKSQNNIKLVGTQSQPFLIINLFVTRDYDNTASTPLLLSTHCTKYIVILFPVLTR